MIRTFIALPIPEEVKASLSDAIAELKAKNHAVRWVKPDGLHITLKFLGDIPEEIVPPLTADLDRAASTCPRLFLALSGFGAFPNVRRPRVVWVGLVGSIQELVRLAADIDKACLAYGVAREKRPFASHITLGRLKAPTMVDLAVNPVSGTFSASEILLYKSVLLPGGAQYTVLHRSSLGVKGG
jgi:RNA 2',3'-cyclic 3'-phosphodiesterase